MLEAMNLAANAAQRVQTSNSAQKSNHTWRTSQSSRWVADLTLGTWNGTECVAVSSSPFISFRVWVSVCNEIFVLQVRTKMITLKTLLVAAVQFISWALLGNSQQPANGRFKMSKRTRKDIYDSGPPTPSPRRRPLQQISLEFGSE